MTRIAYVSADPGVPVFGHKGCSVHVREMCRAMVEAGFDVTLFTSRRGGTAPVGFRHVPVIDLPAPRSTDPDMRESEAIAANEHIMRALHAAGPFDIVYERAALWTVAPMQYAARTSAVGIVELNAPLVEEQARYRTLVRANTARELLSLSLRMAKVVAAVSEEVAADARTLAGRSVNVHVVPNGVDVRRFVPRGDTLRPSGHFVVGFVGSLKPWHGLPTLVEAFAMFASTTPDARLLIVGDGPERERTAAAVEQCGYADRLTITGALAHDDVPGLLSGMDVAVAPYPPLEDFYFSPLKVFEYMAAGLPVVASDIGQVTSVIRHEQTGLLFTPGDAREFASALRRLHRDPLLRNILGQAGRTLVAERHTWTSVLERIVLLANFPFEPPVVSGVRFSTAAAPPQATPPVADPGGSL